MSNRRVQHKPPRDTSTQDLAELKRELRNTKRQLARANREIARLQGTVEEKVEEEEEKTTVVTAMACPKCSSTDLGELSTPTGKTVYSCRSCRKWRSRAQ